ncbi:CapA family protein [Virgibacillus necropolis]|uniref:Capsule biosynthesis protein n=1 Tax=Virgibacillus necropolis TaxID=163877 RepID=A0A221MF35_9BACI|nr:CapA family protein [Virgibacillus necropolis]ASN06199.1 capsule biosynthesis protein [Virgibacillus necropolis]
MKIVATGDSFITRRLPKNDPNAIELKKWMESADVRFTNLETTAHKGEGFPSAFSGGTWAMSNPKVLDDLKHYGFNLYNWANNHTLDYLYGGLFATEEELEKRHLIHAGAGRTLSSAAEPRYLETLNGRVALIGATSTFHKSWIAGETNRYIQGRPGVNPLRYEEIYYITKSQWETLKEISHDTHIDANEELNVKEGFSTVENSDTFLFAGKKFKIATETYQKRSPLPEDINRITRSIREANRQADFVIVSLHSHEMNGIDKNEPADFFEEAAKSCIDSGASCVLGHGPHVIRGIEIYKNKPIFYSLGNFIFQNDTVTHLPQEFFTKYDLDELANIADGLDKRSDNGTKGLGVNPLVWESIVAKIHWKDQKVEKIELKPTDLGFKQPRYNKGWPKISENDAVLQRLKKLSSRFGTEIKIENNVGFIYMAIK